MSKPQTGPDPQENDAQPVQVGEEKFDLLASAPWWLISAGIHVVVLLIATLVYVEKATAIDDNDLVIKVHPSASPQMCELDRPKDIVEREGVPSDDQVACQSSEPALFDPEALKSRWNKSPNNDPHHQYKGQSLDDLSSTWGNGSGIRGRSAGNGPGLIDAMGVGNGGGGGGRYGGRFGGKENLVKVGGGTGSQGALDSALRWLARHQSPDGSWKCASFSDNCQNGAKCGDAGFNDFDAGVTGLATLAFLGAGYTHLSHDELKDPVSGKTFKLGEVVKKAIRWLVNNQDSSDGCIGPKVGKMMYNHSICALALSEAYGMTESQILKEPAQKAIDFLVQAKNPYKAWRYSPKCGENDSSVTGWCVMALKSAEMSNLNVGHSTMEEALEFVDGATDKNYGKCGYQSIEDAGVQVVADKNKEYKNHEALSAVGMVVRTFVNHDRKDPILDLSAKLLTGDLPIWDKAKKSNDYYYWYYGTLALFQFDGPDSGGSGAYWKGWNGAILNALVKNQRNKDAGCADGSWDADDRWGYEGGRVYATAINALTLEVYYRYANAFSGFAHKKAPQGGAEHKEPAPASNR